jgi:N-sulfoglucosamine sulfohydrolase
MIIFISSLSKLALWKNNQMNRREFLTRCVGTVGALALSGKVVHDKPNVKLKRPNILFALADDWSWPHASIVGAKVIKTPAFDRIARDGVMFINAFVVSPSCTPSRASIVTGQYIWRLEQAANLQSTLDKKFDVYSELLEKAGYHVGFTRKGFQPADIKAGGRRNDPAGLQSYKKLQLFLQARPAGKPFCYWFGSRDPHRPYKWQSGADSGMDINKVDVPPCLPDCPEVRSDICDYYWAVQQFDRHLGILLETLEKAGELDNTIVVVTSDNGMPFPRCKANLYDLGTQVPLAIRWPGKIRAGRVVEDFVSLQDLAPTFLEAAGLKPPAAMTGKSLLNILTSGKSGQIDPTRDKVFTGRERHNWCRKNGEGFPMRAIRTKDFLYIRNFEPDRWPAGESDFVSTQEGFYGDIDKSPTKTYMMKHKDDPAVKPLFEPAFGKRPAEELYDLSKDPNQMYNVSDKAEYAEIKHKLASVLTAELKATNDPRIFGKGDVFDKYPYYYHGMFIAPPNDEV